MADYMDLFVIGHPMINENFLAKAPWLSRIEVGDNVIVEIDREDDRRDARGEVIAKIDVRKDDEETIDFLKSLNGTEKNKDIPRIIKVVREVEVKYDA